jgi:phosphoglycolate phosphatase-like HAD superfamily hydrolase
MSDIQVIVFDFNGTIVDTVRSTQHVLERLQSQFPNATDSDRAFFSHQPSGSFLKNADFSPDRIPQLIHQLKQERERDSNLLEPLPDIDVIFQKLSATNLSLGILTSTPATEVLNFINQQNFGECVDFLYSSVPTWGKPKVLSALLKSSSISPQSLLYVSANATNIKAIGTSQVQIAAGTWGFHKRADLETYQPTYILDAPKEILQLVPHPVEDGEK